MIYSMNAKKIVSIVALAFVATFGLTACSSVTLETVAAADHKIIEEDVGTFSVAWSHEDFAGNRQKMEKCPGKGWLDKNCFETPDKTIRFEYSTSKGSAISETITVDGFERKADCVRTDGGWGNYRCAAIPE